jgi:hypothetical protein
MQFYESYDSYIRSISAIIERIIEKLLLIGRATAIAGKPNYCACAKWKSYENDRTHETGGHMRKTESEWGGRIGMIG